jgi:hypothetical protein
MPPAPPRHRRRLVAIATSLLVITASCSAGIAESGPATAILFVGNSLTYVNDLPQMVRRVAEAAGGTLRVGMVAGPNLAVVDHTTGATDAPARIAGSRWDVVVLQQGPTPAGICRDTLVIAAMRLEAPIRAAGGRPALFLPWSRQGAPASLDPAAASATAAARAVGGIVVPIGIAWKKALEADATLPLYGPDGYHPAPAGTLLAALTVYERLLGGDATGIPPESLRAIGATGLTPAQLRTLTVAAHQAGREWPPDPDTATPADTTRLSAGGGPC